MRISAVEEPISVLFVDTNSNFLRIIVRLLTEYYHQELTVVGAATSPEEAIQKFQNLRPHVILLGVGQYSQEERSLIAQLREAWPTVAILLLGPHDLDLYRQAALAAGVDAYLAKSTLNRQLVPTIRRLTAHMNGVAGRMVPEPPRGDSAQA
jgi:DNA-binding NarL/FixJ family response regulator